MILSHGVCSIEILEISDSRRGIYVVGGLRQLRNMNLLSTYMNRYGCNSKNSEHNTWTSSNTNVIDHLVFQKFNVIQIFQIHKLVHVQSIHDFHAYWWGFSLNDLINVQTSDLTILQGDTIVYQKRLAGDKMCQMT